MCKENHLHPSESDLDFLSLRGVGALDPHRSRHVPAGSLEDLAEGPQVLLLHRRFLLSVGGRGLHRLHVGCRQQQRV